MHNIDTSSTHCSNLAAEFDAAIKLIGNFWTLRIIDTIRDQELRFCEIERAVSDICPATLTARLKKLEEEQVVQRQQATIDRQSVVYTLTAKGKSILPVLEAIKRYTDGFKEDTQPLTLS